MTSCAGIVLCGGRSVRMGQPKLALPFGGEPMLLRVLRPLRETVSPIVVVAAVDQAVPELPEGIELVRDEFENLGPLAGLSAGLEAVGRRAEAAYVTACDTPLLTREFIRAIINQLGEAELAVVREGAYHHPLAAVYRTSLAERAWRLVQAGRLRPLFLIQESQSVEIAVETLRAVDPDLNSLRNTNTPDDYATALRIAGLPLPE